MNWNYIGIDDDPPPRKIILMLTAGGQTMIGTRPRFMMNAWCEVPEPNLVKQQCQNILRGLPELHMVRCILAIPQLLTELTIALAHYHDEDGLADFTDLIRTLDKRAHNGVQCLPNFHK